VRCLEPPFVLRTLFVHNAFLHYNKGYSMKRFAALLGAAVLAVGMYFAGAVTTSAANADWSNVVAARGEYGSARNIISAKKRLEVVIDQLNRDQRDYGGHRAAAVNLLQQGRAQLQAAIDYDSTHPNIR